MRWLPEGGPSERLRVCCAGALALTLGMALNAAAALGAYAPDADELALLALCNESRAAAGLRPLVWHNGLGEAARAHSTDMAERDCYQHNSCNGQSWSTRIGRYYPSYFALGENINLGSSDPRSLHDGWMSSPGHRANILGPFSEFGAGIALGETNFGMWAYATEDFGDRGAVSPSSIPSLPSGGIAPRIGGGEGRDLVVNYYHHNGGAPHSVRALVGTSCVNLSKTAGSAANGSYGTTRTFTGSGCVPVVFEAIRSDGVRVRWPQNSAVLVGVGAGGLYCAETTTAVPTQDCGGPNVNPSPTPSPAPTPAPTPTEDPTGLGKMRVALKPGKGDASEGVVQISAKLPRIANFDPASGPVVIDLSFGRGGDWEQTLPQLCGDTPCLVINKKARAYRAKYDANTSLALTLGQDGAWSMRLVSRKETLAGLDAGPVSLSVTIDGQTFTAAADGELKTSGLFVD